MYDVCIIGSGAGASGVAYILSMAGVNVVMLEKGSLLHRGEFSKDEIAYCRRDIFTPNTKDEYHTTEELVNDKWIKSSSKNGGYNFFNGNTVGGATNFMSGYFHKMQPNDFKLLDTYGEIAGANIANWAISFEDLKPYYDMCESLIGISGDDMPFAPLDEHEIAGMIDSVCKKHNINATRTSRAIITKDFGDRKGCYYSNFCGSYGCSSGAKSSSRESIIYPALKSGNLKIISNTQVTRLIEKNDELTDAEFVNADNKKELLKAKIFVIACGAIESSRLLLNSKNINFPNGLSNNSGNVGKNLIFSSGGIVSGEIYDTVMKNNELLQRGLFTNRSLMQWYEIDGEKGGVIDIEWDHANPIRRASRLKYNNGELIWGKALQEKLFQKFKHMRRLNFEIFCDWTPTNDTRVTVDAKYIDKFGMPIANVRLAPHEIDVKVGNKLAGHAVDILNLLGAKDIKIDISFAPPTNLQAGGCRFGDDPEKSVLNKYCQSHEVKNLFVTDGSFMPTGGSVPHTWTIYANSLRVGKHILNSFFS
jgi:choline dehydrogenase-like flavoprotein